MLTRRVDGTTRRLQEQIIQIIIIHLTVGMDTKHKVRIRIKKYKFISPVKTLSTGKIMNKFYGYKKNSTV